MLTAARQEVRSRLEVGDPLTFLHPILLPHRPLVHMLDSRALFPNLDHAEFPVRG